MESVEKSGDLTVSDLWGPAQTEGPAQENFFFSFTDAKTRYSMVYFIKMKDEGYAHFIDWKGFIETQTGNKIKILHSDNGGEYLNKIFKEFCAKSGIIMQTIASYSSAQNGIEE